MAPLLLPGVAGSADPLADLRASCVQALREISVGADRILALCPRDVAGAPAAYHRPGCGGEGPLSEQVAAYLVELAGIGLPLDVEAATGGADVPVRRGTALLVLGDGTACRSAAAPGYLDERAFDFDDDLATTLAAGDGARLAGLDQDLASELLVTGRRSFAALGRVMSSAEAELRHREDPFGVTYFVALWRSLEAPSETV